MRKRLRGGCFRNGRLGQQTVVFGVGADPKPLNAVGNRNAEGAIMQPDADAPILPGQDRLEMQRGMCEVLPQQGIVSAGKLLNVSRKGIEALPEPAGREMLQISRARPALNSASASDASVSSFPAAASASI